MPHIFPRLNSITPGSTSEVDMAPVTANHHHSTTSSPIGRASIVSENHHISHQSRASLAMGSTNMAPHNLRFSASPTELGLLDYNRDFIKLLACGGLLLTQAIFYVAFEIVDLVSACTRLRMGFGLFLGLCSIAGAVYCTMLYANHSARFSTRACRFGFGLQLVLILLSSANIIRFYSTLSWNLEPCSGHTKLLLGVPTIVSIFCGVPAAFIAAVIFWNTNKWLQLQQQLHGGIPVELFTKHFTPIHGPRAWDGRRPSAVPSM